MGFRWDVLRQVSRNRFFAQHLTGDCGRMSELEMGKTEKDPDSETDEILS